jgi:hypothetical protein
MPASAGSPRFNLQRPHGLLEPCAAMSGTHGSEGALLRQRAGATRRMSDRSLSSPPACRQKTAAADAAAAARRISATVRSVKPWIAGGTFASRLHAYHHRTDATAVQRGSVTGPPIIGWLVSRTGSCQPAWWMSCAFAALGGLLSLPLSERRLETAFARSAPPREDEGCEPESAVLPAWSLGRCDRLLRLGPLRRNSGRTCSAMYAKAFPAGCFSSWFPAVAKGSRSSCNGVPRG